MSQFGFAEEPGENKAGTDIYGVTPPALIPPGVWRPRGGRGAVVDPRLSCLHDKQPRGVQETRLTKEELVPLPPLFTVDVNGV